MNRYYFSNWGRFTTPDPSRPGNPENPQSWNYYPYAAGDPVNFNDPEGLDRMDACNTTASRTGEYDPSCTLVLQGGGGFTGFRETEDSLRWEVAMAQQRVALYLKSLAGASPEQAITATNLGPPKPDVPLDDDALFVLSQVGKTTAPLTEFGFWYEWTEKAVEAALIMHPQISFARSIGLLNRNDYVRIGWGYKKGVGEVFRISIGGRKLPFHIHIDLWRKRP